MYFGFVWVEEEGAERKRKKEGEKERKKGINISLVFEF
jgi:hypothetical protein